MKSWIAREEHVECTWIALWLRGDVHNIVVVHCTRAHTHGQNVFTNNYVDTETNLALNRPTRQSSTKLQFYSSLAVDGVIQYRSVSEHGFADGACTDVISTGLSWWAVDLGDHYYIKQVVVYNINKNDGTSELFNVFIQYKGSQMKVVCEWSEETWRNMHIEGYICFRPTNFGRQKVLEPRRPVFDIEMSEWSCFLPALIRLFGRRENWNFHKTLKGIIISRIWGDNLKKMEEELKIHLVRALIWTKEINGNKLKLLLFWDDPSEFSK